MDHAARYMLRHEEPFQESSHDVISGHSQMNAQMNAIHQVVPFPPGERRAGGPIGPDEERGQILPSRACAMSVTRRPPNGAPERLARSPHRRRE
jgi:hypothetical protein